MRKGGGVMSLLREGKGKGLYAGVWGALSCPSVWTSLLLLIFLALLSALCDSLNVVSSREAASVATSRSG
jgi:hypothetical protein